MPWPLHAFHLKEIGCFVVYCILIVTDNRGGHQHTTPPTMLSTFACFSCSCCILYFNLYRQQRWSPAYFPTYNAVHLFLRKYTPLPQWCAHLCMSRVSLNMCCCCCCCFFIFTENRDGCFVTVTSITHLPKCCRLLHVFNADADVLWWAEKASDQGNLRRYKQNCKRFLVLNFSKNHFPPTNCFGKLELVSGFFCSKSNK